MVPAFWLGHTQLDTRILGCRPARALEQERFSVGKGSKLVLIKIGLKKR